MLIHALGLSQNPPHSNTGVSRLHLCSFVCDINYLLNFYDSTLFVNHPINHLTIPTSCWNYSSGHIGQDVCSYQIVVGLTPIKWHTVSAIRSPGTETLLVDWNLYRNSHSLALMKIKKFYFFIKNKTPFYLAYSYDSYCITHSLIL